jgi:hypothetical protein
MDRAWRHGKKAGEGRQGRNAALIAASAALCAASIGAQPTRVIPNNATCGQCTVQFERVVELGSSQDSILLRPLSTFGVMANGTVLAAQTSHRGVIAVYDQRGQLIRAFGRSGDGPGEFRIVAQITVAGDRIHILDRSARRISIFSRDFVLESTHDLGTGVDGNSELLVYGDQHVYNTETVGSGGGTIAVVRGDSVLSDAISPPLQAPTSYVVQIRRIASVAANQFWASHLNRYRLELWNTAGRLEQVLTRSPTWFEPWVSTPRASWLAAPQPMITGIRVLPDGLIWMTIRVAKEPYAPAPQGARVGAADASDYVDTIIEVIDPANATLEFSQRFPGERRFVGAGGHLGTFVQDADGIITWTLWRMRLVRPG